MLSTNLFFQPLFYLAHCDFDKTPTASIIGFEIFIGLAAITSFFVLSKIQEKIWLRFILASVGILIFELFTGPMWYNYHMGKWAYVYRDVSWILTIGWTSLVVSVVILTDNFFPNLRDIYRFPIYLGILTFIAFPLEILVVQMGVRGYADETLSVLSGIKLFSVPIEAIYYIPVFMGLVVSFYKYWSFVLIDDEPLVPLKHRKWLRSFLLAFLAIFLFEVMIEPMVINEKFPSWSYIFHDVSFLMITVWILIVGIAAAVIGRYFAYQPIPLRFALAIGLTSGLAVPLEAWLIHHDFRIYADNVVHEYIGFKLAALNVPIELAVAIPLYMALIIAFIRYWETVIDNRL
ncbi:hypothetical protein Lepto7376_2132 [[Leptolyngbya] sp. PCC 7376]|uniref:hypothetical protein n=1 Tax=[Leptolyngbya] sp. PCC 7376 TaxID=111781 RepID=UPI00029F249E|nr:hypothetical protein [[Leptolyngbya] sp. PCC 7376]AFY38430.1 hypothetical protein Lepto7376_2132 [[Leptolyngbya] sp. PCC 7376]